LFVERVLLLVGPRAGDDLDGNSGGSGSGDQSTRQRLHRRQQRRDVLFAALISERRVGGSLRKLADDLPVDRVPCLRSRIAVDGDAELYLHCADGGIERHFASPPFLGSANCTAALPYCGLSYSTRQVV